MIMEKDHIFVCFPLVPARMLVEHAVIARIGEVSTKLTSRVVDEQVDTGRASYFLMVRGQVLLVNLKEFLVVIVAGDQGLCKRFHEIDASALPTES